MRQQPCGHSGADGGDPDHGEYGWMPKSLILALSRAGGRQELRVAWQPQGAGQGALATAGGHIHPGLPDCPVVLMSLPLTGHDKRELRPECSNDGVGHQFTLISITWEVRSGPGCLEKSSCGRLRGGARRRRQPSHHRRLGVTPGPYFPNRLGAEC